MKPVTSVLYYPHIEIANDAWLKASLLLWDCVYRIVPKAYTPTDNYPVKLAADHGLVQAITLEPADFQTIAKEFTSFLSRLPFLPAGLDAFQTDRLHKDKIDSQLYPVLERLATRIDPDGFLDLPEGVSRGYMMHLAKSVAGRRNLATATDSRHAWTISPYYHDNGNYDENVCNPEAQAFYTSMVFRDLVPANLMTVDMKDVVEFVEKRRDERENLRNSLNDFVEQLAACDSPDHVRSLCEVFVRRIEQAKQEFRRSMGFLNRDDRHALLTVGMPVAATVFGALGVDPFSFTKLAGSVSLGAVAAYADYKKVKFRHRKESDMSYLVDIDDDLIARNTIPNYERIFEEFIND